MSENAITKNRDRGVLLVNLGSPDSPTVPDVRRYLGQFLMDERVLDVPWLLRKLIVSGFILPFRPKQSAEAYRQIWTEEGSPLVVISRRVAEKLQAQVDMPVALAMTYGNPSIDEGLRRLLDDRSHTIREVFLIPLFPHYAMSTYETVVIAVRQALSRLDGRVSLTVQPPFYNNEAYIDVLVAAAQPYLQGDYDHLLFSYHGLPERHLRKTDPTGKHCLARADCCLTPSAVHATCYRAQVFRTTEAFVRCAGVPASKYSVAFQSRLGRDRWLRPYTAAELARLAQAGVKRLRVVCPAFVADCLETLEEIGTRGRETFLSAGGAEFQLIPCLNDHPRWLQVLANWSTEHPRAPSV